MYGNNFCVYIEMDYTDRKKWETSDELLTVSDRTCCLFCGHSAGINARQSKQGTLSVSVHVTPFVAFNAPHVAHLKS